MTDITDAPSGTPVPGDAIPFVRTVNGVDQLLKFDGLYIDKSGILRVKNAEGFAATNVTGNYIIAQDDAASILISADDSDITYTVPNLLPGSRVTIIQGGAGKITFSAGEGITLHSGTGASGFTVQQWSPCELLWLGNGNVLMTGALA
ncbi:MAG: hypothetical protein LKH33_06820 [Acetobacter sp.]|jgi:hypothetical protein|nr:hypothetical protein [Acetobacter sp.]MCH4060491.1 hypothetical protein [Acetobacter sp.]MCH4087431.1 hypothetical protein [Acetobacter sp.]MCI1293949.1 hypothetical protein [Acetobacter sp.]MCI1320457.1 hypothetical protein [Acetobacter sp.]